MKIIFYKDWKQIGCKVLAGASEEEALQWLKANHDFAKIKHVVFKEI